MEAVSLAAAWTAGRATSSAEGCCRRARPKVTCQGDACHGESRIPFTCNSLTHLINLKSACARCLLACPSLSTPLHRQPIADLPACCTHF